MVPVDATNRLRLVRAVFASAAWAMLVLVIVGYVISFDDVDLGLRNHQALWRYPIVDVVLFLILAVTAAALWFSAVYFATLTTQRKSLLRTVLFVILVAGNFVAAFFYYFGYVVWHKGGLAKPSRAS